jgi:hypothetical protein
MYPAPGLTIVKPVMTPPATVAVTVAGVVIAVDGRYASSMVTVGVALYPVPPSTTVTVPTGPFGSGLKAQLP